MNKTSSFHCLCASMAACLFAMFLMAQSGSITTKDQKAKEAVDTALRAVGGTDKINGIKSLIIKGTEILLPSSGTVTQGGIPAKPSLPYQIEIRIMLPDSFIIIIRQNQMVVSYDGVSQGTLIPPYIKMSTVFSKPSITPDGKVFQISPERIALLAKDDETSENYEINKKLDEWSRFLIGTLMKAGSTQMVLSSGSTSGVFTLTKADDTVGKIEFDSKTGYPSVIRYKTPEEPKLISGAIRLSEVGGGATGSPMQAKYDEIRFLDRFSVNGIMFPRVITKTESKSNIIIEWRIEEVRINPKLSLKDFELPEDYLKR